jgi:DNA repair protein RecO (recombination protein O)
MYIKTDAIILREARYNDADKILTVLTRSEGLQTVKARGACRKGSAHAAGTQLLAYSEFTLFAYKNRYHLNETELLEPWLALRGSLTRLSLCAYAAELCGAVALEGVESGELLDLLRLMLWQACYKQQPEELLKAAYEMTLMRLCGYAPNVLACADCGKTEPERPALALREGALFCAACGPPAPSAPLSEGALQALRYLAGCEVPRCFSFSLAGRDMGILGGVAERYVREHLERGFSTLDFYRKLL